MWVVTLPSHAMRSDSHPAVPGSAWFGIPENSDPLMAENSDPIPSPLEGEG